MIGAAILFLLLVGLWADADLIFRRHGRLGRIEDGANRLRASGWDTPETIVLGACLAISYALLILASAAGYLPHWEDVTEIAPMPLVAQTLAIPVAGMLCITALRRRAAATGRQYSFGLAVLQPREAAARGVYYYAAVLPPLIGATVIAGCLLRLIGYPIEPQFVVSLLSDPDMPAWCMVYFFVLAVVVAPVFEETLFRGVLFTFLLRHFSTSGAVVIASLLFAGVHMHLPSLMPLFVIAVGLSLAYARTGSLLVPILMHALFNAVNLAVLIAMKRSGLL